MGTDRYEEFRGACPCGAGELVIDHCTPDHSWPTATPVWYETSVNCPSCSRLYVLQERGKAFVLVERAKLDAQSRELERLRRQVDELMKSDEVKAALGKVVDLLRRQPSKAAVYRLLKGARLFAGTQSTFYGHWSEPERWVSSHATSRTLDRYLALAGMELPVAQEDLQDLQRQIEASSVPVAPVGEPVYLLN